MQTTFPTLEEYSEGVDALGTPRDQGSVLNLKSALRVLMSWIHPGIRVVYSL